jgi:hypothetical protein
MQRQKRFGVLAYASAGLKLVTLAGLAALMAACSTTAELPPSEPRLTTPSDAVIIPPPGGPAIVSVVSTTFSNAVRQDIFLATEARTAGENKISVILFAGRGSDGSDAGLRDVPFSQINLTEEALAAWPDSGMAVSPYFVQNAYGPFGYAIGKPGNGDTCIYAWQRIEPWLRPSGAIRRGSVIIRLQLCQRGASEQQLLEVMYRLRVDETLFPPGRAPAAIGVRGNPIIPVGADGFAEVIPTADPAPAPRPAAASAQVRPVAATPAAVAPVPAAGAPIVPLPPTSGTTSGPASGGPVVPRPPSSTRVPAPPADSD